MLVNNAGISVVKPLHEHTPEEWDAVMNTNVKAGLPGRAARDPGDDPAAVGRDPQHRLDLRRGRDRDAGGVRAVKGAVHQMTRQMAIEYAPHGIRVNAICCGTVDTPIVHKSAAASGDPDGYWAMLRDNHPIGRIASADEVAAFFTYMASDLASFFTGAIAHDGRRLHRADAVARDDGPAT